MWAECKKQDKKLSALVLRQRRRGERNRKRRQENSGNPFANICITATPAGVIRSNDLHAQQNSPESLIPWNVDTNIMIDRFDARELLNVKPTVMKTIPAASARDQNSDLNFLRYHNLVLAEAADKSPTEQIKDIKQRIMHRNGELGPTESELVHYKLLEEKHPTNRGDTTVKGDEHVEYGEEPVEDPRQKANRIARQYGIYSFTSLQRKAEDRNTYKGEKKCSKRTEYSTRSSERDRSRRRGSPIYDDPYMSNSSSSDTENPTKRENLKTIEIQQTSSKPKTSPSAFPPSYKRLENTTKPSALKARDLLSGKRADGSHGISLPSQAVTPQQLMMQTIRQQISQKESESERKQARKQELKRKEIEEREMRTNYSITKKHNANGYTSSYKRSREQFSSRRSRSRSRSPKRSKHTSKRDTGYSRSRDYSRSPSPDYRKSRNDRYRSSR